MARNRPKFLETRYFGFVIAVVVVGVLLGLDATTAILDRLEYKTLDLHFTLKTIYRPEETQEGVQRIERNPDVSEDIVIVGVDNRTLAQYGRWPFARSRHADLLNTLSRVSNSSARERALFLDFFFVEPSEEAVDDALLAESIERNGRVFLETILDYEQPRGDTSELLQRHQDLYDQAGRITNVSGPWTEMISFFGLQPPLQPFAEQVEGYGHANLLEDWDKVYRRAPLVLRFSELIEEMEYEDLSPDMSIDTDNYERLVWFDKFGLDHTIKTPLTQETIDDLWEELDANAPPLPIDNDDDGEAEEYTFVIRRYQDNFIPSITLSLAAEYLNVPLEEIEVNLGEYVRLPDPQQYNTETGEWEQYKELITPAELNEEGETIRPAEYETRDEIIIPINENGMMLINYMGPRSSASSGGYFTYPVRSYASYASSRVPAAQEFWPPTIGMDNKLVMVGAFSQGMAEDEKLTPFGLMYGVEIHANALNTIVMDNFVRFAPTWMDLSILVVLTLLVAALTSRLSTMWSGIAGLLIVIVMFFVVTTIFDNDSLVIGFATPALSIILTFVSIIAYRVMTEEKDKQRIREMFGRYVSPAVVSEILEHPPELGGVDKEMTVMFSDIRGFTSISEALTPQELVNLLNEYLTAMTDLILDYDGTLDKYMGDAIMCFWGAPLPQDDHAYLACRCALRQIQKLHEINENLPSNKRLDVGIGVNSGIMTVGNVGSSGRLNYTVMGDNVNLGSRLEGTNKTYGTNVIISEYTYGLVKDRIIARELDSIRVKGKNRPVTVYELIDLVNGEEPEQA